MVTTEVHRAGQRLHSRTKGSLGRSLGDEMGSQVQRGGCSMMLSPPGPKVSAAGTREMRLMLPVPRFP